MAQRAIRRKANRNVGRIRRPVKVRLMAAVARSWQCGVVVVRVALSACNAGMRTGKWERRIVVIERCPGP